MEIGPILVDTNGYSAFKRGEEGALEIIRAAPGIILNPVILGELLSGYAFGGKKEKNTEELESFLVSQRVQLVPIDGETSRYYAEIYRELRQKGKPIPTNDLWIAATAMQYNLEVFTYDRHFREIENLKVVGNFLPS